MPAVDAEDVIDLRDLPGKLGAVHLRQAAGDHEPLVRPFVRRQLQHGVDRLLLGSIDEAAGIDDQEVGGGGTVGGDVPAGAQQRLERLGIDDVLRAAERHEVVRRPAGRARPGVGHRRGQVEQGQRFERPVHAPDRSTRLDSSLRLGGTLNAEPCVIAGRG
jgi:hypothetical protein